MKKLDFSYIFWKLMIGLLLLLMLLAVTLPVYYLFANGDFTSYAATRAAAVASFFAYFLFQYFFLARADLSGISFKDYYLGEVIVYALLTLLSSGVLAAVSGGMTPVGFSYVSFAFLPHLGAAYLCSHIVWGAVLQIALYALLFPLLYLIKKKKDPALTGAQKKAAEANGQERTVGTEIENSGEKDEEKQEQEKEENDDRT